MLHFFLHTCTLAVNYSYLTNKNSKNRKFLPKALNKLVVDD